jgi:hypothetical protein
MAVMVNSYKAQSILRGVPSCRRIAACDLGGRGAEQGTLPAAIGGHRLIHVFSAASSPFPLPMHLKPGADALAAGSLAEIGHCGGNLEGTIELLLGAERIVIESLLTLVGPAPSVVPVGRMLNLTDRSLPNTWTDVGAEAEGNVTNGMSVGPIAGGPSVSVTE